MLAILAALLVAAPAEAATRIKGVPAPGPTRYDYSYVTKYGPANARTVLVLVPGYLGGAGDVALVGREIAERAGIQVWAVDRRSQALEDTALFERGVRGEASLDEVFRYYAGWITDPSIQPRYTPPDAEAIAPLGRRWGLPTHLGDLRAVVRAAKRGGRRVILGGHSLGGSVASIYATWDFGGRPGFRDLDGLVLIDGGPFETFERVQTTTNLNRRLRELEKSPFGDAVGLGLPWAQGIFSHIGGLFAMKDPTGVSPFWNYELLPAKFRTPFPSTNRALLAHVFDLDTTPPDLGLDVRAGHLAESGDPRDWVDDEITSSARVAQFFGQQEPNSVEWFFPERLRLDVDAANPLTRNAVTRRLKLRPWHLAKVDVPLYVFQTDYTDGRLMRAARRYVRRSRVPRRRSLLVDRSSSTSHNDPVTAAPATNDFLKTVVPFLERLSR